MNIIQFKTEEKQKTQHKILRNVPLYVRVFAPQQQQQQKPYIWTVNSHIRSFLFSCAFFRHVFERIQQFMLRVEEISIQYISYIGKVSTSTESAFISFWLSWSSNMKFGFCT